MKRLSPVTLVLAVACSTPPVSDPVDAFVAPPEPLAMPAPLPLGLQSRRHGSMLELTDGERHWEVAEGEAASAIVSLSADGSVRGLWSSRGTVYALESDGSTPLLATYPVAVAGGIAGFTMTLARLVDLDADGANELVLRHQRHDDTGSHERVEVLTRTAEGPFGPSTLTGPRERAFNLTDGPIEDAIRARRGASARVIANVALDVVPLPPPAAPNLGPGFPSGVLFGIVSALESDGSFALELDVVRAWPEAQILASTPIGTMHEDFTGDACRVRVRTGIPMGRATTWGEAPASRAIAIVWADGSARRASVFSWDRGTLATLREPVELDRCDTPARDLSLEIDPATRLPALTPIESPTALW